MLLDGSDLKLLTDTGSLAISAAAFAVAAVSLFATRRNTDIAAMFDVWGRYERYTQESEQAATPEQKLARFLNLLNYVENICYIFNNKYAGKTVLINIRAVASDFIAMSSAHVNLADVLRAYSTDPSSFCEIRKFCENNEDLLLEKALRARGSIYTPPRALRTGASEQSSQNGDLKS